MQSSSGTSRRLTCGCLLVIGLLALIPPANSFLTSPVERGLVRQLGGRPWMRNAVLPGGHHDVAKRVLSPEDFQACARRVSGWDLIVVLQSYGSGRDVIDHPAVAGLRGDLRYEIQGIDGYMNEGVRTVLVIRDERIAERFHVTMSLIPDVDSFVVTRDG
jgi:hypothetical protein